MAFSVITNDDTLLTVGDMNNLSNNGYWWFKGTSINLKIIYDRMVNKGYTVPTIFFTDENLEKVLDNDYDTVTAFRSQYYWYIGDILRGGICFDIGRNFHVLRVTAPENATGGGVGWVRSEQVPATVQIEVSPQTYQEFPAQLYLMHQYKVNGHLIDGSDGTTFGKWMQWTPAGGFTIGKINWGETVPQYYPSTFLDIVQYAQDSEVQEFFKRPSPYVVGGSSTVLWIDWWSGLSAFKPDPNQPGGTSGGGGGEGQFDNTSDIIPIPELPPDMLINSGVIKIYSPTVSQLNDFLQFIYTSPTAVADNFKKIWADPMQSIISFGIVPFSVNAPTSEEVKFCGVSAETPIYMNVVSSQYVQIDLGYKVLDKYWDGALDQNNYTKIKLFLPFIGFIPLNADEVIGATVTVKYNVDLLSGDCMAFVYVDKQDHFDIDVQGAIYSFKGNVLCQCPLTGNGFAGLYGSILNTVTGVGGSIVSGNPASVAGIAKEVMGQKVDVQRSSSISANSGNLGEYSPFFVIERPIQSLAANFAQMMGYPSNTTQTLNSIHGYTLIDTNTFRTTAIPHISGDEALELLSIMNEGIILP